MGLVCNTGAAAVIDYWEAKRWRAVLHVLGALNACGALNVLAYVEKLHIVNGYQAKSSESMVRTNGIWIGALTMAAISYVEVLPQDWQSFHKLSVPEIEQRIQVKWKSMHASKRTTIRKQIHRARAVELLPQMEYKLRNPKDHDRADALLMALMAQANFDIFD